MTFQPSEQQAQPHNQASAPPPRRNIGAVLAVGFGTTVAMWTLAYLAHLPGVSTPAPLVFGAMLACLLAGGFLAGRWSPHSAGVGFGVGFVAGVLNLMVLGSLLTRDGTPTPAALLYIPGSILAAAMIAGVAGLLGRRRAAPIAVTNWPTAFANVALLATGVLLSVGGVVTGYDAGLAVPDWPNSFGVNMFAYPLARMTGGIYYEHAHRLFGSLVGLTTLTLTVYLLWVEPRRWVRTLALLALLLVIAQGVLGGLRVTGRFTLATDAAQLAPNLALAVTHGVTAQVFFSMLAALRVVLGNTWREARPQRSPAAPVDRTIGALALVALLLQISLGALLRHFDWGLYVHLSMALAVLVIVGAYALRLSTLHESIAALRRPANVLTALIGSQFMLGFLALGVKSAETILAVEVLVTTLHQTLGAVLLAFTTVCALLNARLLTLQAAAGAFHPIAGGSAPAKSTA